MRGGGAGRMMGAIMAAAIPFVLGMEPAYGRAVEVSPLLRRITARNPSPFTYLGTNTYLVGRGEVAVIDPGPLLDDHVAAILQATSGERITHIAVTHTHLDHSPACAPLREASGAPAYGFGPHGSGKALEGIAVEEGGDMAFRPDRKLTHGDRISGPGWTLEAVYTPGHTSNHLCFGLAEERALLTGDHVMGWSTSVIAPPDGDMGSYMRSLELLLERGDEIYWPAHGEAVRETRPFIEAFIAHRRGRETAILAAVGAGREKIPEMVALIYKDVDKRLHQAAGLSVLAHIEQLHAEGRLACAGAPSLRGVYRLPG